MSSWFARRRTSSACNPASTATGFIPSRLLPAGVEHFNVRRTFATAPLAVGTRGLAPNLDHDVLAYALAQELAASGAQGVAPISTPSNIWRATGVPSSLPRASHGVPCARYVTRDPPPPCAPSSVAAPPAYEQTSPVPAGCPSDRPSRSRPIHSVTAPARPVSSPASVSPVPHPTPAGAAPPASSPTGLSLLAGIPVARVRLALRIACALAAYAARTIRGVVLHAIHARLKGVGAGDGREGVEQILPGESQAQMQRRAYVVAHAEAAARAKARRALRQRCADRAVRG
ncbi:hypothetical protein HYPSUDRAFT_205324 [Hypholoma sublateritium FD-334 SS-4]|uniref:Uncharacterized protein n=1 Tax=Hypholoma sublateritium (strain FD-334 SS-4) TaxID=945553 RepID=A0A0D2PE68_HYPSF|nr:hypothetical protein HYPSUDRAFT_205324 [Hypholoma sublateritium FD-334 SS-4]